ncbi:MAG: DUF3828 domain-containing protein [Caulobacterales bacterium]
MANLLTMTSQRAGLLALGAALALGACSKPAPSNAPAASANAAAAAVPPPAFSAAPSADATDAKAFLDGLYARYQSTKDNNFNPMSDDAPKVFDKPMLKLLKDEQTALKGELGAIDGDWLCACQDFVSLKATVVVQSATATTAKATADFTDTGMPGEAARHNAFDLVKEDGFWRIHDVQNGADPSLRKTLTDEIASLAKGGKSVSGGD